MDHYNRRRIKELIYEYNRPFPAPYYFERFLTGKKEVKIADLGSGPICTLGNLWGDVKITIYASDILAPQYSKLVEEQNCKLITPVEYQNMENLTYPDEFFDVVHCVNALDHTKDAQKALNEMKRVCKKGGIFNGESWVILDGFHTSNDGYFLVSIMKKS